MNHRQLGKDGPRVSVVGLGAWPIGGGMGEVDRSVAIDTVRAAIDGGITLVDTAQGYGASEATLGKALEGGYRERCFVATKVSGQYSRAGIEAAIEDSLRALDVDYVDLFQIHGWDPHYPIAESMEAMARLQEQGKTRFIGVSNFNAAQMREASDTAPFQSNQPRYSMLDRDIEGTDLGFCRQAGIGILAHSPLAKGLLTGKYSAGHLFPADDERAGRPRFQGDLFARYLAVADRLKEIAADKSITLVQLAIAWLLRQPEVTCVLAGAKSPEQAAEYVGASTVTFAEEELERIETILRSSPEE